MTSWYNENPFHITGPLWGGGLHRWRLDSLHKRSVMQVFDVSLMLLVRKNCWTNTWVAGDLRPNDIRVTSLKCVEENMFENLWKVRHFVSGPVSLREFLYISFHFIPTNFLQYKQEQQTSLSNFTLNCLYFKLEQQSKQHFINSLLWNLLQQNITRKLCERIQTTEKY